jgi:DNA-binding response OmpR family regulator
MLPIMLGEHVEPSAAGAWMQPAEQEVRVAYIGKDERLAEWHRVGLELDGYSVTVVEGLEHGLDLIREIAPDIIFVQARVADREGASTMCALRADADLKNVPLIVLADADEDDLIAQGFPIGTLEYVVRTDRGREGLAPPWVS